MLPKGKTRQNIEELKLRNSELSMTRAGAAAAGVELMTISRVAGDCDAARSVILPSQQRSTAAVSMKKLTPAPRLCSANDLEICVQTTDHVRCCHPPFCYNEEINKGTPVRANV